MSSLQKRAMLNRDFKEFAQLLDAQGVDYLVVGDYALAAHGHPRYTGDIDFWIEPSSQNIAKLLLVLDDFGFASLGITATDFDSDTVLQLGQPPRRIDLLTSIDGVAFDACFARREQVVLADVKLNVIGLDDLKVNKRSAGRLKDLADLESLEPPTESS
jgi:predicted nucleotidyltransferase